MNNYIYTSLNIIFTKQQLDERLKKSNEFFIYGDKKGVSSFIFLPDRTFNNMKGEV